MPPVLQAVYVAELKNRGLLEIASKHDPKTKKKIYGGPTIESTNEHFSLRYIASAVRVEDVLLDTGAKFGSIPKDVLQTFASHKVTLLDVPCGAVAVHTLGVVKSA